MIYTKPDNRLVIQSTCKKNFISNINLTIEQIKISFDFARKMADPNESGAHNPFAFGGGEKRGIHQIFQNAFQGKLAEFAFYNIYKERASINIPETERWEYKKWEDTDFTIIKNDKEYNISLKSTKSIGNLLLLEKDRYNEKGEYLESADGKEPVRHDYIFLARISGVDSKNPHDYNEQKLKQIKAEITGYISNRMFIKAIQEDKYIKKGVLIGGQPLQVDNYWFCAQELHDPKVTI